MGRSGAQSTVDEVAHLPAGLSQLEIRPLRSLPGQSAARADAGGSPTLISRSANRMAQLLCGPYCARSLRSGRICGRQQTHIFWYFTLVALGPVFCSVSSARGCAMRGRAAAVWNAGRICRFDAVVFFSNILGNAALITPDCGAAALGVAGGYCFCGLVSRWPLDQRPRRGDFGPRGIDQVDLDRALRLMAPDRRRLGRGQLHCRPKTPCDTGARSRKSRR